jgi:hypothetical protein
MTESLAVARTESEMFQKLWMESQVRAQTLGANLTDSDATATHRQLVESLRMLYLADAERQRLAVQLHKLVSALTSNQNVLAEVEATRRLLAGTPVAPAGPQTGQRSVLAARVLDVNPKLRLVVLDIGAEHGARVGMPLLILRGDRVVATVRVVEVRARVCGAVIEKLERMGMPQTGDTGRVTQN